MKNQVEKDLLALADEKYLAFHQTIINDEMPIIGVRMPILRDYAKKIGKERSLEEWLEIIPEKYYEEILLKGILIGNAKNLSWQELQHYIQYYVPKIRNWGLCDMFCSGLKITKKYRDEIWKILPHYLESKKEFDVRFALVMLLNYYIDEEHLEEILKIVNDVKVDAYYVKMANAWLISYLFIQYYDETVLFYQTQCQVDDWTYNKGIQKAIESYRLTPEQKEKIKKMRR